MCGCEVGVVDSFYRTTAVPVGRCRSFEIDVNHWLFYEVQRRKEFVKKTDQAPLDNHWSSVTQQIIMTLIIRFPFSVSVLKEKEKTNRTAYKRQCDIHRCRSCSSSDNDIQIRSRKSHKYCIHPPFPNCEAISGRKFTNGIPELLG